MKKYVSPELEVLKLNVMDVITTSAPGNEEDDMGWASVGGYDVVETADR